MTDLTFNPEEFEKYNPELTENVLQGKEPLPEFNSLVLFKDELLSVQPLPYDLLPDGMGDWVKDCASRIGCAPDFIAVGALTALSSILGRKVLIQPKQYHNWVVTPNLWGAMVGRPSTKKSPAQNEALFYIQKLEHDAREKNRRSEKMYQAEVKLTKLQSRDSEKQALKQSKANREAALQTLMDANEDNIEPPTKQRHIVHNSTVEKLAIILSQNLNGVLTVRDELSGWFSRLDSDERAEDREFYLMSFNGDNSYSYDRMGRDDVKISHCVCSVFGGIQPSKIQPYLMASKNGNSDDGLLQRFQLMVYPDQVKKIGIDRYPDKAAKREVTQIFEYFAGLPEIKEEEISPALHFDNEAQELFCHWEQDNLNKSTIEKSPAIEAHLSKYPALIPSLALIIHLARTKATDCPVTYESLSKVIGFAEYLESHARRIYGTVNAPDYSARSLAENLHKLPTPFTASNFRDKNWSGLNTKESRQEALKVLLKRGYLAEAKQKVKNQNRPLIKYFKNPIIEDE